MWLWLRCKFWTKGTFYISHMRVNYFYYKASRWICFKGTFSFPFRVIPFKRIPSVIGFSGNYLTYSCFSIGYSLTSTFFILYSTYSLRICSCLIASASFAWAKTLCMVSSENIRASPFYLAWELMATMMTMHSSGLNPSSGSSCPFIKVTVSHSSNPLSINSLIFSGLRWSQSLSMSFSMD